MLKPTITPHQLSAYTEPITDIYRALELNLFELMARRLATSADYSSDYVLQWQVERMNELRILNRETIQALSQATGVAEQEINRVVKDVGYGTVHSVDHEVSPHFSALSMPNDLDLRLESFVNQTFREFDNYVNQTLISTNFGTGTVAKTYQNIVEETTAKVLAGQISIKQAVAETTLKWSKQGMETSFVDRGGNTWKLPHYAQTVVRNTVNNTYNELRTSRMDDYGMEFVLVSSLPDARPACSLIQGGVASTKRHSSDSKYPSIYEFGYGDPDGLRGINCRHMFFPFIPGLNINNETQYDPDDVAENYKKTQVQRRMERDIRSAKNQEHLAKVLGDDKQIDKYRKQVRDRQAKIREYVKEQGLPRRYENERFRPMPHDNVPPRPTTPNRRPYEFLSFDSADDLASNDRINTVINRTKAAAESYKSETGVDVIDLWRNKQFHDRNNPYGDEHAKFTKHLMKQTGYDGLPQQLDDTSGLWEIYRGVADSEDGSFTAKDQLERFLSGDVDISGAKSSTYGRGMYFGEYLDTAESYGDEVIEAFLTKDAKLVDYDLLKGKRNEYFNENRNLFDDADYYDFVSGGNWLMDKNYELFAMMHGYDGVKVDGGFINMINRSKLGVKK